MNRETVGKLGLPIVAGDSHPMAYCIVPSATVIKKY